MAYLIANQEQGQTHASALSLPSSHASQHSATKSPLTPPFICLDAAVGNLACLLLFSPICSQWNCAGTENENVCVFVFFKKLDTPSDTLVIVSEFAFVAAG